MDSTPNPTNQSESNQHDPRENHRFNSKNLSPEERNALKSIQREASIYRGYPLALVLGGLTHIGLRKSFPKMNVFARVGLTGAACVSGNVVGKVTYIPTAMKRLEETLPQDSQLREMLNKAKTRGGLSPGFGQATTDAVLPYDNSNMEASSDKQPSNSPPAPRSYDELRRSHREKERSGLSTAYKPSVSSLEPSMPYSENLTTENRNQNENKIRYNKYGDPIIE